MVRSCAGQVVAAAGMGEAVAHIEGVTFVVDAMYGMQPVMDPFTGLEVSEMVPISQAVRTKPRTSGFRHSQ